MRQVSGQTRPAVDLIEPRELIESLISRLDMADADIGALSNDLGGRIGALSNDLIGRIGALSNDVGALSNSLIAAHQTIETLQEFGLVINNGLRNLHNEINAVEGDINEFSLNLVGLEGDVGALSNTLAYEYITINDLNTQLVANYIQHFEKVNFFRCVKHQCVRRSYRQRGADLL